MDWFLYDSGLRHERVKASNNEGIGKNYHYFKVYY